MISIIVPVLDQHEMTAGCIQSIRTCTQEEYELIIIDNGSDPPYTVPYVGFAACKVIRNDTNKGFPAAVNQGVRAASGDVIVLLNNDVIVTPGWTRLEQWLHKYDIVGPVTNYSSGAQKVELPIYADTEGLLKEAAYWFKNNEGISEPVNWVIGFCMAFRKSLFEEIGDFCEDIWPCNGEEIDFCLRAKKAGYSIGIANDVYVHHFGSKTIAEMDIDYAEILKKTDELMAGKWGSGWKQQKVDPFIAPYGAALNLGCGFKKEPGFVNIDNRLEVKPDILCDVAAGLPYSDETIDMIRAFDFLEHIRPDDVIFVMNEIWRVLKPGGVFESFTPSTDGRGAFQDPTHRSFWNRNSWLYYSAKPYRELYNIAADFILEEIEDTEPGPETMIIYTHVVARKRIYD